ncbi:MAG: protease complex subunit PrcB family protein, partial [Pleurocapsa sp. SU_196_0]|nr:protease complex subunit PrcB family protein [Pleurocapsa sp. SU_196_0]
MNVIGNGSQSLYAEQELSVRLDATREEFDVTWQLANGVQVPARSAPFVDFARSRIVTVFLGQKPTGGYGMRVLNSSVEAGTLRLQIETTEPAPGAILTQALTSPYVMLEVGVDVTLEMEAGVDDGVTPMEDAKMLLEGVEAKHPGRIALWAPGVGTQHGLGSQDAFSAEAVARHQQFASSLAEREIGIALHGSSGLSADGLRTAVAAGVAKVNWSSESLLIRSKAAQEYYATHTAQLEKTHADWKNTAMDNGLQRFIAGRYVPVTLERFHKHWQQRFESLTADSVRRFPEDDERLPDRLVVYARTRPACGDHRA